MRDVEYLRPYVNEILSSDVVASALNLRSFVWLGIDEKPNRSPSEHRMTASTDLSYLIHLLESNCSKGRDIMSVAAEVMANLGSQAKRGIEAQPSTPRPYLLIMRHVPTRPAIHVPPGYR